MSLPSADDLRVLRNAAALAGVAVLGPRRLRGLAGLTLGGYVLHRQGLSIDATDTQAKAAAIRGGKRWEQVDRRVADLEDLLSAAEPGGLHSDSAGVRDARRRVVARSVDRLTGA